MKKIFLVLILSLPAFSPLARFGIHSLHDFHPFRQYEYNLCLAARIFPCRWAPDAGKGFGEPVFNYYGHFPYWVGGILSFFNISVINSTKISLSLSLSLSALFMYLLARRYWGRLGGIVSALFYVYAPYRAVDVWVRGALPEAWAFVFFPLIILLLNIYLEKPRLKYLLWLSLSAGGLIITHNLSALMFLPFATVLGLVGIYARKNLRLMGGLAFAGILSLLLSAFYILPVYFEQKLVRLSEFTADLYLYQLHYTNLRQLFISQFWGYGSSVWGPNDNLSFSIGHLHWLVPLIILVSLLIKGQKNNLKKVSVFCFLGLFAVFMTHGKSEFIWKLIPPLSYLQFPWRFLSVAVFFLSLSCGAVSRLKLNKTIWSALIISLLLINISFFRPDIWISQSDKEYFSGDFWNVQRSASLPDYWPAAGDLPNQFAPGEPYFYIGDGQLSDFYHTPDRVSVHAAAGSDSVVVFPVVYFPGWTAKINSQPASIIKHPDNGAISVRIPTGQSQISLDFTDSPSRHWGNLVSLLTLVNIGILLVYSYAQKKSNTD